jgi:transcription initiation factor TFIID subunit 5
MNDEASLGSGLIGTDVSLASFNRQDVRLGPVPPDVDFYGDLERAISTKYYSDATTLAEQVQKILSNPPTDDSPLPSDVPLPPKKMADIDAEIEYLRDLRARIQLGDSTLPSICCYTFHNSYNKYLVIYS